MGDKEEPKYLIQKWITKHRLDCANQGITGKLYLELVNLINKSLRETRLDELRKLPRYKMQNDPDYLYDRIDDRIAELEYYKVEEL